MTASEPHATLVVRDRDATILDDDLLFRSDFRAGLPSITGTFAELLYAKNTQ